MSDKAANDERIALVTGATRGIGRAAALSLAASGAHVIALGRTQGALEELDDEICAVRPGGEALTTLVPCDLKDFEALDRLGEAIYRRWGRLDALVAAAGILGPLTPLHHVDVKAWDNVLAVNLTANWRLIRSLDLLLRRSAAGRAVFVTSAVGSRAETRAYWGPYAVAKAGLRPAGAHLCRRDAQHFEHQGDARQSGPVEDAHARRGDARRRSCDIAHSGGIRPEAGRALFARLAGDRQVV